jgi:hypothetical protein
MKCFVLTPSFAVSETAARVLMSSDIEIEVVDQRSAPAGVEWIRWLRAQMATSDLVLVVLSRTASENPAFMLEVGITLGLNKRVLIVNPEDGPVPPILRDLRIVGCSLEDLDALSLHVRATLKAQASFASPVHSAEVPQPTDPDLGSWLENALRSLTSDDSAFPHAEGSPVHRSIHQHLELERIVEELFRRSGAATEWSSRQGITDLAVMYEASPLRDAPILVTTKLVRTETRGRLRKAQSDLRVEVARRGAQLGVLAYFVVGDKDVPFEPDPLAVAIDLRKLPELLRTQSLARVVASLRNQAFHVPR